MAIIFHFRVSMGQRVVERRIALGSRHCLMRQCVSFEASRVFWSNWTFFFFCVSSSHRPPSFETSVCSPFYTLQTFTSQIEENERPIFASDSLIPFARWSLVLMVIFNVMSMSLVALAHGSRDRGLLSRISSWPRV
jgi:hypothetical protein